MWIFTPSKSENYVKLRIGFEFSSKIRTCLSQVKNPPEIQKSALGSSSIVNQF